MRSLSITEVYVTTKVVTIIKKKESGMLGTMNKLCKKAQALFGIRK